MRGRQGLLEDIRDFPVGSLGVVGSLLVEGDGVQLDSQQSPLHNQKHHPAVCLNSPDIKGPL